MTLLLGSTKGSAILEPKAFVTSLGKAIPVDGMLQLMTSILQQCGVRLTSDVMQIYGFAGPTFGFMGELVYRAGKPLTNPQDPYVTKTVTVTPALQLQCGAPAAKKGGIVYLHVTDPEGWFLRPAEDRLTVLLVDVARILEIAAELPHSPEWTCLKGRWYSEV